MVDHLIFIIKDYFDDIQNAKQLIIRFINLVYQPTNQLILRVKMVVFKVAKLVIPKKLKQQLVDIAYQFHKRQNRPRRYLKSNISIEQLFNILKNRNINYVILRWFENLPLIEKGEDLDLLIADADLSKISDLFVYFPQNYPFDIYSASGIVGSEFKSMPYYPPQVAKKILETRVWLDNVFSIPNTEHHFLSLAYHAIYHKGKFSGIPSKNRTEFFKPDHDYLSLLKKLANKSGITQIDFTYEGIHDYLHSKGWTPEVDTLRKLAHGDEWKASLLSTQPRDVQIDEGDLMVFVVRESALKKNKLDLITRELEKKLDVLLVHMLNKREMKMATEKVRGGKWDKGSFPVSGGKPGCFIVCFDYHPTKPTKKDQAKYPNINNKHVLLKSAIRDKINRDLFPLHHINCIHASDDEIEAWNYIGHVIPQKLDSIKTEVKSRRESYQTKNLVLQDYHSNHTRSKVELIEFNGIRAIKKTFKLGRERFIERDTFVFSNYCQKISTIPPLLASQPSYFIIPWYENVLENLSKNNKRRLIKPHGKTIIDTLKFFYYEGYALIDFHPRNLILTPQGELKIIDFEFLYKYKNKPESFLKSFDIAGIPTNFEGDLPKGLYGKGYTYKNTWRSFLGPLDRYLSDD